MDKIKGFFSAIGSFFGGVSNWVKLALALIAGIKVIATFFKDKEENDRREKFKEGVAEKDTTKVEESFGSGNAGKPDNIGDIEWEDEKPK